MVNDGSDGSVKDASFKEWWERKGGGGTAWAVVAAIVVKKMCHSKRQR